MGMEGEANLCSPSEWSLIFYSYQGMCKAPVEPVVEQKMNLISAMEDSLSVRKSVRDAIGNYSGSSYASHTCKVKHDDYTEHSLINPEQLQLEGKLIADWLKTTVRNQNVNK